MRSIALTPLLLPLAIISGCQTQNIAPNALTTQKLRPLPGAITSPAR